MRTIGPPAPNPGGVRTGHQQPGKAVRDSRQAHSSSHSTTPTCTAELPQDRGAGGRIRSRLGFIPHPLSLILALLCVFHAAGGGIRASVSAIDARGRRVTLAAPPKRIVSLAPSETETLFALGLKGRIAADTSQCDYPPEARSLPHIGDYRTSVEQVVAQRPDLVVALYSANHQAVDQLERLRIPVFAVEPKTLPQIHDAILSLGRITATDSAAKRLVASMKARESAVERAVARDRSRPKVLIVIQADPLMVVGTGSFMDDVVSLAGGDNVGRDAGPGYRAYSPERAVAHRPDVILAGPHDLEVLRRRPGWSAMPAVRNNRIYTTPETFGRPAPRIVDALEAIAHLLHPGAFR